MFTYSVFEDTLITLKAFGDKERKVWVLFERESAANTVLKRFAGFRRMKIGLGVGVQGVRVTLDRSISIRYLRENWLTSEAVG